MSRNVLAVIAVLGSLAFGCSKKGATSVSPIAASSLLLNRFAVLVDLRGSEAMNRFGVPLYAHGFSVQEIDEKDLRWEEFVRSEVKGREIIVCCTEGAKEVAETLAGRGYKVAYFESFSEWKNHGQPVRRPSSAEERR